MQNHPFLIPGLEEVARISYTYRASILLCSVVVAATFAGILLSSKEARLLAGSWVKYVGWAFFAYSFQYFFRLLGWFLRDEGQAVKAVCNLLANLGSGANNVFFLIAALILLHKRTRITPAFLLRTKVLIPIVLTPAALTTAANFYFGEELSPVWMALGRAPDALISAFCLGIFGYATMRNFLTHHRRFWATGVIVVGLVYSLVQLVYAGSPVLAHWRGEQIRAVLEKARYTPKPREPVEYLDSSIFALALPLKMLLFVPAFYLFFTLVIAANDFRKVLRVVTERKRSYLSRDGIVDAIGGSVQAERVELFIRLPGHEAPSAWCIPWPLDAGPPYYLVLGEAADPQLLKVLGGGARVPPQDGRGAPDDIHATAQPKSAKPEVMLPVKFHGAAIGCLKVTFDRPRRVNYAALQQLQSMADLVAPAVQDYRALASLDQLSDRFARLQVQKPGTEFSETTRDMTSILHDVLSPLATGLVLEAGFASNAVLNGEGELRLRLDEQVVGYDAKNLKPRFIRTRVGELSSAPAPDARRTPRRLLRGIRSSFGPRGLRLFGRLARGGGSAPGAGDRARADYFVKVYTNPLVVTPRDDSPKGIGSLVLILPDLQDKINRPTLGEYDLYRRTIASHTADAYLDLVRDHLSNELNALSVMLNAETLTQEEWLESIRQMAKRVGLLWVGLTRTGSNKPLGDPPFAEGIFPKLSKKQRDPAQSDPVSRHDCEEGATGTCHLLRVELKKSEHQVWFGVARKGFGVELTFPSPWKVFLEDFRKIADSALFSLFEIERSKEKVAKLAEQRGVMNIALTTGHLMHQLANKVDDQFLPAESLWEAAQSGDIPVNDTQRTQLEAILNSARVMKDLVAIFQNVTSTNSERPCSLREVIVQALKFYEKIVGQSSLRFKNKVDKMEEEISVDVPYNVALFAVANLIGNAKDAIADRRRQLGPDYEGEILIEAKQTREQVFCYIQDNGAGVPQHLQEHDRLYDLGVTGRPPHNGWGLYFTKNSLVDNGSAIKLEDSKPGLTRFRLTFPKAKGL